jgi:integrase
VLPKWGAREFVTINRKDVAVLLDGIVESSGAPMADRILSCVSKIMNWFASRNDDYTSPIVRGMRRSNPKDRARKRVLSDDEIRALWSAEIDGVDIVKTLLLTAQRLDKVTTMRWEDIKDGVWTIATEKREKGNAGELVLPAMAVTIIDAQPHRSPYVFGPSRSLGRMKAAIDKAVPMPHWTLHDLRRTARSLMSRAGVLSEHAERVLGHVIPGVEGIYNRHEYEKEKADALRKLAGLIAMIVNPPADNVKKLYG